MLAASNCRWIQLDQWCSRGASSSGAPITVAITCDGYGLANASTNSHVMTPRLASPRDGDRLLEQLLEEPPHRGRVALDRPRRQRRVDEAAQAGVVGAVDVQDVVLHLLVQRPLGHAEDLRDLHPRERR